jgi:hypothetical protein
MSEDIDVLGDAKADYLAYKRKKLLAKLATEHSHLTLDQVAKLTTHGDYGDIVASISLQELYDHVGTSSESEVTIEELEPAPAPKKAAAPKRSAAKKKSTTKKKAVAKKAAAPKKPAKKPAKKPSSVIGKKADAGKKKPRLNRDTGYTEILKALKTAGEPCGRKSLEIATGYTGVQVRTFCKELAGMTPPKVMVLGAGGRGTTYDLAPPPKQ